MTSSIQPDQSACHKAPVTVGGDNDKGTHYFVCTKCGDPCDLFVADEPDQELTDIFVGKPTDEALVAAWLESMGFKLHVGTRPYNFGGTWEKGELQFSQEQATFFYEAQQQAVAEGRIDELKNFDPLMTNHARCIDQHTCIGYQNAASDFDNEKEIRLQELTPPRQDKNT